MCGCTRQMDPNDLERTHSKEVSQILNHWVSDNLGRKLLVQSPIYDVYNDIVGYITKNEKGNTIRIFKKNIQQILD